MTRCCIVNVDDLGMTGGVNRAVVDAHRAGVVTSASLMVNAPAAAEAAELASTYPDLSVGLHTTFTHENGEFLIDADDADACRAELLGQIALFEALTGHPPTHLDSHHNVHRHRSLTPIFLEAAGRLGIPLREHSAVTWFGSFYAAWDGETHPEQVSFESLQDMLAGFGEGVTELCSHIAYVDDDLESEYRIERGLELATILDPRLPGVFAELGIELVSYEDGRARGYLGSTTGP
jgi:chitin disaccharide deacetylase